MSKQVREMKDSGIEWIGEIPKEWTIKKFKYTFKIIGGSGFKEEYQGNENGDFPFCKASDINGSNMFLSSARNYVDQELVKKERYSIVPVNSIIVAKIGEALKKNHRKINTVPCIVDNNCEAFSTVSNDLAKYNYYILLIVDLSRFDNGGTVPSVNNDKLKNFYFPCPSIPTQHRIADYLDDKCGKIDRYIEQQKQVIEKLKAYKQSVITEAVTKGLDPTVPMKDSGVEWIGEIPEGWEVTKIKKYCKLKTGTTPSTSNTDWFDGDFQWFTPGDFRENYILDKSSRCLSERAKEDGVAVMVPHNTVLIVGIGATAGKIGYTTVDCSFNQQITAISSKNVLSKYLMYWMIANTKFLRDTALFTTLPILNNQTIGDYILIFPRDHKEQELIVQYLDNLCISIDSSIKEKQTLLDKLTEYKKSLIYEVVTGKKEV